MTSQVSTEGREDGSHYDVLVIGSGFGGSVSALRLAEKGYRVGVLEAGRRWSDADFAEQTTRDLLWFPRLGMFGPMRLSSMGRLSLFSAVGVGGGSLIYANTLYEPHDAFFTDAAWADITDWRAELAPYYDQAKRMLGVTTNPRLWSADELLRGVAEDLGVGETFRPVDVGVHFHEEDPEAEVADPYFGGAGPSRSGCSHCARCTTGCPFNAKNTLPKNYLHLAEAAGADVHPLSEVVDVRESPVSAGRSPAPAGTTPAPRYTVTTRHPRHHRRTRTFTAEHVVFAAAARGTQQLLHALRASGSLPHLSPRLGELARSNSEAIVMVAAREPRGWARGVAITSAFHPRPDTHVEVCHSGEAQDGMAAMNVPMTDGGPRRLRRWLGEQVRQPGRFLASLRSKENSDRTLSLLVMQSLDNSLTSFLHRGRLRVRHGSGEPNPSWIPLAHDVARRLAARAGAEPMSLVSDLFGRPATAHYIGGAVIGADPATGVVDPYHRVHGHPGLHIIDGSTIGANLGVNPSLTITAMAERAVALWPNRGEIDRRPEPGAPYRGVAAVAPRSPTVPEHAPAALRF